MEYLHILIFANLWSRLTAFSYGRFLCGSRHWNVKKIENRRKAEICNYSSSLGFFQIIYLPYFRRCSLKPTLYYCGLGKSLRCALPSRTRRHQCKKFSSNLLSRNKTTQRVKSESGAHPPTYGGIMNEKFYEERRREEKSISFGVIKKTSKERVALCTPQGPVCISICWLRWTRG